MCFFVQTNHTRKELLFLMFKEINLRNHSSLHKLFYSLLNNSNYKYIFYLFSNLNVKNYVKGSAVPTINSKKLKETIVPFPPLEEQSRIAAKIAQLFALLRKVESSTQQYAKLQTLLKSKVLDLAMRGKLVKQDPNDEPASVLLEKIKAEKFFVKATY